MTSFTHCFVRHFLYVLLSIPFNLSPHAPLCSSPYSHDNEWACLKSLRGIWIIVVLDDYGRVTAHGDD